MACFNCLKRLNKYTVNYCACGNEFCAKCLPDDCFTDETLADLYMSPDELREWEREQESE